MFLVEPASGQRCHFNSARALGSAIRRGDLGPQARIFHQTSGRWLPITVHPEYRKVESEVEESSSRSLHGRRWTFLPERPRSAGAGPAPSSKAGAPVEIPMLVPGEADESWLGTAFRSLKHLAWPGAR